MKHKVIITVLLAVLTLMLVKDVGLLLNIIDKPGIFSEASYFSYIHFLLLGEYKLEFSIFKVCFTALLLLLWFIQLFSTRWILFLKALTAWYTFFWIMILVLVATSISGILQQSVGQPVDLLNTVNVLSIASGSSLNLLMYVSIGLSVPTLIFVVASIYAASIKKQLSGLPHK